MTAPTTFALALSNETATAHLMADLALLIGPGDVITLSGDLGAGKTAFAKAFAKALGVGEDVTSPTFVIEKIYALQGQPWKHLVHIDAYRLEGGHELLSLGFEEMLRDPAHIILVEWPEIVPTAIPAGADLSLAFRFVDESVREVSYDTQSLLKTHA